MPERWQPTDDELARSLGALGGELDYPPSARITPALHVRLRGEGRRPTWLVRIGKRLSGVAVAGRGVPRWQPAAVAAGLVLVVFLGSLVAFPTVREAVADWLGLRGIGITVVPSLSPIPTQHRALQLGTPMALDEAQAAVPWRILLPDDAALGPPDEVYLDRSRIASGVVSLVWSARSGYPAASTTGAGLLITELQAGIDERYFQKVIGPGTTIEPVHVGADRGYWISGAPHELVVVDQRGEPFFQDVRLAGDVLMWEAGQLTIRIESALSRDDAIHLGSSIH